MEGIPARKPRSSIHYTLHATAFNTRRQLPAGKLGQESQSDTRKGKKRVRRENKVGLLSIFPTLEIKVEKCCRVEICFSIFSPFFFD